MGILLNGVLSFTTARASQKQKITNASYKLLFFFSCAPFFSFRASFIYPLITDARSLQQYACLGVPHCTPAVPDIG